MRQALIAYHLLWELFFLLFSLSLTFLWLYLCCLLQQITTNPSTGVNNMTFIFIIYVIAGVVLFNTRSKIKSLSFIEWLFVPALIVGNVTLFLFFLFVGLIARLFGRR